MRLTARERHHGGVLVPPAASVLHWVAASTISRAAPLLGNRDPHVSPAATEASEWDRLARVPHSSPFTTPETEERLSTDTWQAVYAAWRLPLLRYVHRLTRDPHLAEDVTQEAFLRLVRETGPVQNPRAWLFHVCTNLVRDSARRRSTEERDAWEDDRPAPPTPDVEAERAETVAGVRHALDQLSQRDRAALLMREEGFRHAEIAQALGVRTEIIPALLARALKRFRRAYEAAGWAGANEEEARHDAPR